MIRDSVTGALTTMRVNIKRYMAQWLERGALPISLPNVRFRVPLGAGLSEKYNSLPLNLGTLLRRCVLGQGTSPTNASLDSGENENLVGQIWQCLYDKLNAPKRLLTDDMSLDFISDYKPVPLSH